MPDGSNSLEFYVAAAQLIPLLLLALVFEAGYFGAYPGARRVSPAPSHLESAVRAITAIALVVGELVALIVLLEGSATSRRQVFVAAAMAIGAAGIIFPLVVLGARETAASPRLRRVRGAFPYLVLALLVAGIAGVTSLAARNPPPSFTAVTLELGARVREGPDSRRYSIVRTLAPQQIFGFSGFCLGERYPDNNAMGLPDARWHILADGDGVVSAPFVNGGPPRSAEPTQCDGGNSEPVTLSLEAEPAGLRRRLRLSAATTGGVGYVGFAARYSGTPGAPPTWHAVDQDVQPAPNGSYAVVWRPPAAIRGDVRVVATACYGPQAPSPAKDAVHLRLTPVAPRTGAEQAEELLADPSDVCFSGG